MILYWYKTSIYYFYNRAFIAVRLIRRDAQLFALWRFANIPEKLSRISYLYASYFNKNQAESHHQTSKPERIGIPFDDAANGLEKEVYHKLSKAKKEKERRDFCLSGLS